VCPLCSRRNYPQAHTEQPQRDAYLLEATDAGRAPAAWILDLQVIRPDPYVELESEWVARIDGEPVCA
jgi:hypothetical protein